MHNTFNEAFENYIEGRSADLVPDTREYTLVVNEESDLQQKLLDKLSEEQKTLFNEYVEKNNLCQALEIEYVFREGIKEGARLLQRIIV